MYLPAVMSCLCPQGEQGGPGQKGSKGDKGESVSMEMSKHSNGWSALLAALIMSKILSFSSFPAGASRPYWHSGASWSARTSSESLLLFIFC